MLPWDSTYFGTSIARADLEAGDEASIPEIEQWAQAHGVCCLYLLADRALPDDQHTFIPVDQRVTLQAAARSFDGGLSAVRAATEADLRGLRELAATNHRASRFFADPRFAAKAGGLYALWIEQRFRDRQGAVLLPGADGVEGYVTCEVDGTTGRIGLMGVAASARGRGIGRSLVTGALAWCAGRGLSTVEVVTQGANESARRLYERCGFHTVRVQYWYHRWYGAAS